MDTKLLVPNVPGYKIESQLYAGSRTRVYRATRKQDAFPVVIKLSAFEYPSFNEVLQFRNQYTISKNLSIPGIIHPLSLEPYGNGYILVMEDSGGISLQEYIQTTHLSLITFLEIAIQLTHILHELHQNRVIHKDIKPANILIHPQTKKVQLIDFSLASLLPKETQEIKSPDFLEGTLAYISPEQTGRMNRGIDYRSDFYTLGVTFYELLTGELPFQSDDPMELVHCHIARQPPTLQGKRRNTGDHKEDIPKVLCDIVSKLMAKNAEDRYQTALGLKLDLEKCLAEFQETGKIEDFEIGQRDICDRFLIPEKLYGRETAVATLLQAFERVANGSSEIILVAGFSGIGKTAIINEVHKPVTRQHGYFIKGKFDQLNRKIPLFAFVQALRDLIRQLLSEPDRQLGQWRAQILLALGDNAQVLIEVIPELEKIIGKQPPAPELSGTAAQNRFNSLLQKFIQVFTTKEHPLVMCLDDLQWADSASLKLMRWLLGELQTRYLLLIGAYRDNEVFPAHPLMLTLAELKKAGATLNTITLKPLSELNLNQLIADTLSCELTLVQPLTTLVYQKTQGNPFFARQFLNTLHQEGLITFDAQAGHWQCDITQVRAIALTDDVVEFMVQQLQKLPIETQEVLKLAACIGNQFDLSTAAIVSEQSASDVADALWKALQAGFVVPQSEVYKFYIGQDKQNVNAVVTETVAYRFLHDRVQQAAYALIPEAEKQTTHLKIGRLLWKNTPESQLEERIFEIANQLNLGFENFHHPQERHQLVQLNLTAGRRAKAATAYSLAMAYLKTGLQLLPLDLWQSEYDLTLSLYNEATEVSYLSGELDAMEDFAQEVLQHARVVTDTATVYEVKIGAYTAQGKLLAAINTAMQFLQQVGIEFPQEPTTEDFALALQETQASLSGKTVAELVDLPEMQHPELRAVLRVLVKLDTPAYLTKPELHRLLVLKEVALSVKYGNTSASAFAYSVYGLMLCSQPDTIPTGYEFGQLALRLLSKFKDREYEVRVLVVVSLFITHWQEPVTATFQPLQQAYISGLESGDLIFAGYAAYIYCSHAYTSGQELTKLANELTIYGAALEKIHQQNALSYNRIIHQIILNLIEPTATPWELVGTACDERAMLALFEQTNDSTGLWHIFLNKLILCYLFQKLDLAMEYVVKAKQYSSSGYALVNIPLLHLYDSLLQLALFPTASVEEQPGILQQIAENQNIMHKWANYAPMNHLHRFQLVEAEKCRVLGQKTTALELYDSAIAGAKENGYLQDAALSNELAAKFYLDWGKDRVAADYMQEAYYCYARWGAKAKIIHLEQNYPQLLAAILQPTNLSVQSGVAVESTLIRNFISDSSSRNLWLDFPGVLKAAQAISQEIELEKLLATLMQIALANAGAQIGCLLLRQEEQWLVSAQADQNQAQTLAIALEQYHKVPQSLIYAVIRTQETAVFENLSTQAQFVGDCYVSIHQPKSVLCTPISRQGKLIGILYLENNLTVGAFTSDRIEVLQLLTSQAAIALENARLYQQVENYSHTLEAEVEQKTLALHQKAQDLEQALQELQQTQAQLIHSEKMSSLGQLVAGIAHEINNPISFIMGNLNYLEKYITDMMSLLSLYQQGYSQSSPVIQAKSQEIELDFLYEDVMNILQSMQGGSERISQIVLNLRSFSRLDEALIKAVDLHSGIESTLSILQNRLQAWGNQPEVQVVKEYGNLPTVTCYPSQINQVFFNILNNAIDAIREHPESGEQPQIWIRTQVIDGNQIRIAIANSGSSIPSDIQKKIFEPFFTTKPVGRGKGLGLFVSYSIIKKHGGTLTVNSQSGQKTEFVILLPSI